MPHLRSYFKPSVYLWKIRHAVESYLAEKSPNLRGAIHVEPGHFYSPLLDIESMSDDGSNFLRFDGEEYWEHVDLNEGHQREYFKSLAEFFQKTSFPIEPIDSRLYYSNNDYFPLADAYTLSGIIRKEKPSKIIEIGAGFSSAVMLDTIKELRLSTKTTFIEPYPQRLNSLLSNHQEKAEILEAPCQEIPLDVFHQLSENDILFIDSCHVAKIGSDVTHIILRILPILKPGVLIHFHDVVYPLSYPIDWVNKGIAWNESLFLRAFLLYNNSFQILAFNSFAWKRFPQVFEKSCQDLSQNSGGSLWLRKLAR